MFKNLNGLEIHFPKHRLRTNDLWTTATHRHILWRSLERRVSCRWTSSVLAVYERWLSEFIKAI